MIYNKDQLKPYRTQNDKDTSEKPAAEIAPESKSADDWHSDLTARIKKVIDDKQRGKIQINGPGGIFIGHHFNDDDDWDEQTVDDVIREARDFERAHYAEDKDIITGKETNVAKFGKHQAMIDLYSSRMFSGQLTTGMHSGNAMHIAGCFGCTHRSVCCISVNDPIVTGYLGDCESRVMLVGEAPSMSGNAIKLPKLVLPCPPLYSNTIWSEDTSFLLGARNNYPGAQPPHNSPLILIDYLVRTVGKGLYPYFTDLIKCGIQRQNGLQRKVLTVRQRQCVNHILWEEIRIINPEHIICCHERAYRGVVGLLQRNKWKGPTTVYRVYHYSQANAISSVDKLNFVWPIQTGFSLPINLKPCRFKLKMTTTVFP